MDELDADIVDLTTKRLTDNASDDKENVKTKQCKFCESQAKYCCPRCNDDYCSTKCFECDGHRECHEEFAKRQVLECLKSQQAGEQDKKKMIEMLKRIAAENADDDCLDRLIAMSSEGSSQDENLIIRIMNRLNISDDQVPDKIWEQLTDDEKMEFANYLDNHEQIVHEVADQWQPWWMLDEYKKSRFGYDGDKVQLVIQTKGPPDEVEIVVHNIHDAVVQNVQFPVLHVPALQTIRASEVEHAHLHVTNCIFSLLLTYCHLANRHNGEFTVAHQKSASNFAWDNFDLWTEFTELCPHSLIHSEFVYPHPNSELFQLKAVLSSKTGSTMQDISKYFSEHVAPGVRRIVSADLLVAKMGILLVLSDVIRIFGRIHSATKGDTSSTSIETRKKIQLARKKIEFFMSLLYHHKELENVTSSWIEALDDSE